MTLFTDELTALLIQALHQYITPTLSLDPEVLAYRFSQSRLVPIHATALISLDDLQGIDTQKAKLIANTEQFLHNLPANHVLMTGARGAGKSSLIRALLGKYAHQGLRVIEVSRDELLHLDAIRHAIAQLPSDCTCKYIVYCDDLAFNSQDENYRTLKSVLDGSLDSGGDNLLVYATSNRRHLLPQLMKDNVNIYNGQTDEINPYETIDETVSLSDRFGLWLSFYPVNQDGYLQIVSHYLAKAGLEFDDTAKASAIKWASERGGRSGRIAYQFSRDFIGKKRLASL